MKIESITDFENLDSPRVQRIPGFYGEMFQFCTSLKNAPKLPATELADYCYMSMFDSCTALKEAPALPATKLATACYDFMFAYCSSLVKAPALPAMELARNCYANMFYNCESLEEAPELPATNLVEYCYFCMFFGCPKLNYIKVGFEDWREDIGATAGWLIGVGSEGLFECPEGLEVKYTDSCIPTGWSVNGAAPGSCQEFSYPEFIVN